MRLIDENGEQLGVVERDKALALAKSKSLDLVLMAEMSKPPVAKIFDYGKFLFEEKKKKSLSSKKQHNVSIKEVKVRPGTEDGDYQVKIRNLTRFLNNGDKTKVTLRFRGREMIHQELGKQMLERIQQDLIDIATVEHMPVLEGRQMVMVLAPIKKR